MRADTEAFAVMSRQYGLISRRQAIDAGVSTWAMSRRTRTGEWVRQEPGVYRHRAYPACWHASLLATCLRTGGVASRASAGWLWKLDGIARSRPTVVVGAMGSIRSETVRVHESVQFDGIVAVLRDGIPCTPISRTLIDLAGVVRWSRFEAAVDDALRRNLVDWPDLLDTYRRLGRRGRNGSGALRRLLDERFGDDVIPRSVFSRLVAQLLIDHGVPAPELEYPVPIPGWRAPAHVDLAYPKSRLAIELQSVRHHLGREPFEKDALRAAGVAATGWRWLPITYRMYRDEPTRVVDCVRHALLTTPNPHGQ